jgi:hypothetical protein
MPETLFGFRCTLLDTSSHLQTHTHTHTPNFLAQERMRGTMLFYHNSVPFYAMGEKKHTGSRGETTLLLPR